MLARKEDGTVDLTQVKTVADYCAELPSGLKKLIILITGTNPGTGASTLKDILATMLHLESVEAGKTRRAIALDYSLFYHDHLKQKQKSSWAEFNKQVWRNFISFYFDSDCNLRPLTEISNRVNQVIGSGLGNLRAQENITLFTQHQTRYGLSDKDELFSHASRNFDLIPDLLAYQSLTDEVPPNKLGLILEGKLGVVIEEIANKNSPESSVSPLNNEDSTVIYSELKVSSNRSAERVVLREIRTGALTPPTGLNKEMMVEYLQSGKLPADSAKALYLVDWVSKRVTQFKNTNKERMVQDYQRWSNLYQTPLSQEYITNKVLSNKGVVIDTSNLSEEQTTLTILLTIAQEVPELSPIILNCLTPQLQLTEPDIV